MFYLLQSAINTVRPVAPDRPHTETGQTHIKLHLSMLSSILTHGNTTKDSRSLLVMHELTQTRLLGGRDGLCLQYVSIITFGKCLPGTV